MRKIFVAMLSLPLLTSFFFIMCTKAPSAPETPAAVSVPSTEAGSSSIDTSQLEKIEIHTESIDGKVHWMPATVTVKAGQDYLLVAKHELSSGFDFHGLMIPEFGVQAQVNRNKEYSTVLSIPADKKGSFNMGCQFHPAHQAAKLVVE